MLDRAIFLDRDGVITENVYYAQWGEWEAPMTPNDVKILPGAIDGMLRLQNAGFRLFVVSNQAAYAKGKTTLESLVNTARHVESLISQAGVKIVESYYSYTHPKGAVDFFTGESLERKPNPYFLLLAAAKYGLYLPDSWMLGDRDTDIQCGLLAGCRTGKIIDKNEPSSDSIPLSDVIAPSLDDAARQILKI